MFLQKLKNEAKKFSIIFVHCLSGYIISKKERLYNNMAPKYLENINRNYRNIHLYLKLTFCKGITKNAPPPAASITMARNLGLTAQKLESHELFVIFMLS